MLKVVVGHSEDVDSFDAIEEIIEYCSEKLDGLVPQAGILYCAIGFEYEVILEEINKAYPEIELIGCSSFSEMSSTLGNLQDSIVLTLFVSDTIEIKAGLGTKLSENVIKATEMAVSDAISKMSEEPKFCITTPESLTCSAVELVEGLKKVLGKDVPIIGGIAADQWKLEKTYQFYNDKVVSDAVPVLMFGGNVIFSFGVSSGWEPIGNKRIVTKVDKNIVHELDNESIVDFYNYYLGEYSLITTGYPLAVFPEGEGHDKFYLRNPQAVIEETKSIMFFGDVPHNAIVQLTEATSENIIKATEVAINQAIADFGNSKPQIALTFSCAGRSAILGGNTYKETDLSTKALPENCLFSGFYSYGEIAPLVKDTQSLFHNTTFVILLIGEK